VSNLAGLRLPDCLRARIERAEWRVEYLEHRATPWWDQYDGAIAEGLRYAFVRLLRARDGYEDLIEDAQPDGSSSIHEGPRLLCVTALDTDEADTTADELVAVAQRRRLGAAELRRCLKSLAWTSIETSSTTHDGAAELHAEARRGEAVLSVMLQHPPGDETLPARSKRSHDRGSAYRTAENWRMSVSVINPAAAAPILAAIVADD
jgi:hypothetical protein